MPAEPADHLFRQESGRLVAALTRVFGVHNLALAEDVVQDAFCRALETWKIHGVPDNPSAWLMTVAKRRALDVVRRERTARTFAPEISRMLDSEWTLAPAVEEAFAGPAIRDEQLRMMFSCCHPRLSEQAQVGLILNVLCGFSADEIASAFLTGRAAVEKRLSRGKKVLASAKRLFDLEDADFRRRLAAVLRALYLLFNEGYHGASSTAVVRGELCGDAIHLVTLLLDHRPTALPESFALGALMCLQGAHLPARMNAAGSLSSLAAQDRTAWDARLIAQGRDWLDRSASGTSLTPYHIEAAIAATHAAAPTLEATDWATIVTLYDRLLVLQPSPVVALNRAIAIAERDGPAAGLAAMREIPQRERLTRYPFYPAAMGELESRLGRSDEARAHFDAAIAQARNASEREFFERRRGRV